MCIVNIFLPQSVRVAKNSPVHCVLTNMCFEINSTIVPPPPLPPPQQPSNRSMRTLNMKSEADRLKTREDWHVPFMDENHLTVAGFCFTNWGDVVRCAFCGVEVGYLKEGDDAFIDHQRWSPSCGFMKGLFVGNIPIDLDIIISTNQSQLWCVWSVYGVKTKFPSWTK